MEYQQNPQNKKNIYQTLLIYMKINVYLKHIPKIKLNINLLQHISQKKFAVSTFCVFEKFKIGGSPQFWNKLARFIHK